MKSTQAIPLQKGPHRTPTSISCSAILFDLDGVLIDSTPSVQRVWTRWALERGFNVDDVVAHAHGRPSLSTVRRFLPDADHELENREVERREIADVEGIVVLPGAAELLKTLPAHRWTIATSCTRSLAEARLRAAGLPVPASIVTATDVTHGKPDPEPFLKAAAKLGFGAADCVVFEDAPAGIRAGKAAGAKVVALRTTFPEAELNASGADFIVRSCADISVEETVSELVLSLNLVRV